MPELMQTNAIDLLKEDHKDIKELFKRFDGAADDIDAKEIAMKAIERIQQNTFIEEEILYPQCRRAIADAELVMEAQEAHHVAKIILTELKLMPSGPRFNAKFRNLSKGVMRHFEDEEGDLFPRLQGTSVDLEEMGTQMMELRRRRSPLAKVMMSRRSNAAMLTAAMTAAVATGLYFAYSRQERR